MNPADFPPNWLLTYFVLGWLLGLLAVRDWKWAALCGLTTTLAIVFVLHSRALPFAGSWLLLGITLLGLLMLWGISRLPEQRLRVVLAALLVPIVSSWVLQTGGMLFFIIFKIP